MSRGGGTGGKALVLPTDVADAAQVETAATRVEQTLDSITLWINDAMTSVFSPAQALTPEGSPRLGQFFFFHCRFITLPFHFSAFCEFREFTESELLC